jgi:adenylate cyclase
VRDHVHLRLGLEFEALGPQALKNIARPVEAFALRVDPGAPAGASAGRRRQWKLALTGVLAMLLAASGGIAWWLRRDGPQPVAEALRGPVPPASASVPSDAGLSRAPRLSLVVLPFDNLDSSPEQNALADGITEDLTTGLAQGLGLVVTARNSAFTYKGRAADIKLIGNDLAVRYALEGSVRKVGTSLRVNAQLVSTETGAHLWADQVDADAGTGSPSHDEIIGRISTELYRQLIDIESVRGARERPGNPDATDLLLQAAALYNRMWSAQQQPVVMGLYERAVQTDPSSVEAMAGLARTLLDNVNPNDPSAPAMLERVEALVAAAESLEPGRLSVIYARGFLLQLQERGPEAIAAFQNLIDRYPNSSVGYHMLGTNLLFAGRAADTISNEQRAIRIDPRNPFIWQRYRRIGQASLLLGRYDEAVGWLQRSLAALPSGSGSAGSRAFRYAEIAAAHAFAGRIKEARGAAAEASRLLPTITVREWSMGNGANPVFGLQIARVQEGMRIAGVRDHADEDADFGVVPDDALHMNDNDRTPTMASGVRTVRTTDLLAFLEQGKPLVLDVSGLGKSIPGAVGLRGAGIGGNTSDPFQARLSRKMQELTHGYLNMPVVTMAWNADRFSSRNLALRLAALGYTNVIWYRGGREAWEAAGLPETEVVVQEW